MNLFIKWSFTTTVIFANVLLLSSVFQSFPSNAASDSPRVHFETLGMKMQLQALTKAANPTFAQDMLEVVFQASDSEGYMAFSVSRGQMTGHLLGCDYPSSGATTAKCVEMTGEGYDAKLTTSAHTLISANNTNGVAIVVLQIPIASFGVTAEQGMRRAIFARGPMKGDKLGDHHDKWSQLGLDIYGGVVEIYGDTTWTYLILFLAWLASVLTALVGAAMKQYHSTNGRTVSNALHAGIWLLFTGCFVAVCVQAHSEFSKKWAPGAIPRALGAGCAYIFSLIMFPTTRYLNIGYLCTSYERLISYHVLGGWILVIVILVHAIWFLVIYASAEGGSSLDVMTGFFSDGTISVIPALAGLGLLLIMFVVAIFRNRISYYWFRVSHFLFPLVIIAFSLHYVVVAVAMAPGIILWLADFAMRFTHARSEDPQISAVEVDTIAKIVKLTVSIKGENKMRWARSHSGQYAFFSVTSISELPHPFTFIHRARDGSEITFMIRASGHFTEQLYLAAKENPATLIHQPGLLRNFTGPVGVPEVDHCHPTDIVYVAGGIGITATQGLLFDLVEKFEDALKSGDDAAMPSALSINFVWSVREPELVRLVLPYINECCQRLEDCVPGVQFMAKIFITGAGKDQDQRIPQNQNPNVVFVLGKRPDPEVDLIPLDASREGGVSAYFSCGPAQLMEQAKQVADARKALLHEEVFNF